MRKILLGLFLALVSTVGVFAADSGAVTEGDQTFAGDKTFTGTTTMASVVTTAGSSLTLNATTGALKISPTSNSGAYTTTVTNAAQGGAYTYTIPNQGGAASFVMNTGTAQTISSNLTLSGTNTHSGAATFTGGGTYNCALTATGTTTLSGTNVLSGTNIVSGAATFSGGGTFHCNVTMTGPLTTSSSVTCASGGSYLTGVDIGAASTAPVMTVVEHGTPEIHQTYCTFAGGGPTFVDAATNAARGIQIYDFPEGRILILGVTVNGVCTSSGNISTSYYVGLGTTQVTGTPTGLTGTQVDICPSVTVTAGTSQDWHGALAASAQFDGTTTAKDVYLNVVIPDANISGDASIVFTGTAKITWINLGDY